MARRIPPADEQLALLTRGAVDLNVRDEFAARLHESHEQQRPLKIKAGFDPTMPDLHIGHAVVMDKMAQFQRMGHEVILLVGNYTALIGDPTGRNAMRPPLSHAQIEANAKTYTDQAFEVLDASRTRIEWNAKWLETLSFRDVIDLAARSSVGRMLERRDFKQRFESGSHIALHEFLYPLMQGYDSVVLEADVELGGHDQIFNLNLGRQLMKAYGLAPQIAMTVALLTGTDGVEKMSKSKGNYIGITEAPDDMFAKVMSISDETMVDWYELLSDDAPDPQHPLESKKQLAHAQVRRFHGRGAADDTLAWWDAGRPPRNLDEVEVPSGPLYAVVTDAGMAKSRSDARRKITQGGVSLDGELIEDGARVIGPGEYLLRVGKKSNKRITVRDS